MVFITPNRVAQVILPKDWITLFQSEDSFEGNPTKSKYNKMFSSSSATMLHVKYSGIKKRATVKYNSVFIWFLSKVIVCWSTAEDVVDSKAIPFNPHSCQILP